MGHPPAYGKTCQHRHARQKAVLQLAHRELEEERDLASYPVTGARKGHAAEGNENLRPFPLGALEPAARGDHLPGRLSRQAAAERRTLVLERKSGQPLIAPA